MMLKKLLRHNWKTTISGAITGAALGYVAYSTGNPELFVAAAGAFGTGLMGKDAVDGIKGKINE
jgi:hypothetical protein